MTLYTVTAWCDRIFRAQVEVEAETPQEALLKARTAIDDAPAEECDDGYHWDQWRVDTAEEEGVLSQSDDPARLRIAAGMLLAALNAIMPYAEAHVESLRGLRGIARTVGVARHTAEIEEAERSLALARVAFAEADGRAA